MSEKYTVETSTNTPTVSDLVGGLAGAWLLQKPDWSGNYRTTITDNDGNVVATGTGDTRESSRDDAYTNLGTNHIKLVSRVSVLILLQGTLPCL
ncbi:hypothetical protein HC864_00365 [Candidatus Gracilibacteria bacterium]|nr:hypothetical protein [Candidatus Gracilibacteria bacterium]